jgi:hypothetical protein
MVSLHYLIFATAAILLFVAGTLPSVSALSSGDCTIKAGSIVRGNYIFGWCTRSIKEPLSYSCKI